MYKNKKSMKMRKSVLLIALVVLVSIFVYYRYAKEVFQAQEKDAAPLAVRQADDMTGLREVSALVTYDTPGDYPDSLRFVVVVDAEGTIQDISTLDAETGEIAEKKKEFNTEVNMILKGKKLSELSAIDKVGKSSLTTDALNEALPKLQAAL
jgi:uncharacterized protein YpmB